MMCTSDDDVEVEQVVLKMSFLIWEMHQSNWEKLYNTCLLRWAMKPITDISVDFRNAMANQRSAYESSHNTRSVDIMEDSMCIYSLCYKDIILFRDDKVRAGRIQPCQTKHVAVYACFSVKNNSEQWFVNVDA